ncbi:YidB family protein [Lichenihabitans sp. Uapishka_5]|uniref:YidB family protein n=1 Tax=Lichenihabitans sp. Uapishka_5 TaxID=3037302 RepID=UPI0029E8260B|nr:YidB family protein [Lichenihabitans sp. Uapishka_5]MDX7952770.1 YidB family protein [Lichenihabitans sp. Uapishka_5]
MGILENSIGAMFGQGPGNNDGPSFGAAYAPLATALIGLLATKAMTGGFGNLGNMLGGGSSQPAAPQGQIPQQSEPQGGGGLLGGLGGLLHSFERNGMGQTAQSWIGGGENHTVAPAQVQQAIGPDMIRELAQRTGRSEQDVAQQLSQELPEIVNRLTPQGRMPTHQEASGFLDGSNPLQAR